jgi:hypothetical protein
MLVIAVPTLILFPLSYASGRVDFVASRFRPEMVAALVGAQVLMQMVASFVLVGGVTRLFLWRVEAAR